MERFTNQVKNWKMFIHLGVQQTNAKFGRNKVLQYMIQIHVDTKLSYQEEQW